jgi:NlpC/P60 family putative phage cell wall peptidase
MTVTVTHPTREGIAAETRSWIGTPYHHQASLKGVGCDCLGLLRGVWRAAVGPEPEAMVAYTPDWGQATGEETLLAVANRHLVSIALSEARPGDVLIFRMKPRAVAKHCGILITADRFIHAHQKAGTVEANLSDWWAKRVAAVFAFPGIG